MDPWDEDLAIERMRSVVVLDAAADEPTVISGQAALRLRELREDYPYIEFVESKEQLRFLKWRVATGRLVASE